MSLSDKTLKTIKYISFALSIFMIFLAYFQVLPKNIAFFTTVGCYFIGVFFDYILKFRMIKDETVPKRKKVIEIIGMVWFAFLVLFIVIILLIR